MRQKQKPVVIYDSRSSSGNIYAIMGKVRDAMRTQRRIIAFNDLRDRVFEAGSYEEALAIFREEVELIDIQKK